MLNTLPDTADPKDKEITVGEGWEVMLKAGMWTGMTRATLDMSAKVVETSTEG